MKKLFLTLAAGLGVAVACCSDTAPQAKTGAPERIVSLAPSITETLFALGLGDRIVGVTKFCSYPPAVDSIEKVGGYTDTNLEKIVRLKPDLVVLQVEHEKHRRFLKRFEVPFVTVDFGTLDAIQTSIVALGKACGAEVKADSLVKLFRTTTGVTRQDSFRPRVLLCVGRDSPGGGRVRSVYAAGAGTFYNGLIEAAGGKNAIVDSVPHYPKLSLEGIITVAPEVIIDVAPAMGPYACSTLVADWKSVAMVPAVDHNRVYCLAADYATVPGPRLTLLLNDLRELMEPLPQ